MKPAWMVLHGIALAALVSAQTFEVASIRPNKSGSGSSSSNEKNGRYIGTNVSLRDLIEHAYDVLEWRIDGPEWIRSERFDVIAKPTASVAEPPASVAEPPASVAEKEFGAMMQNLLAERFKLRVHWESRETGVYSLMEMKGGIKAARVENDGQASTNWSRNRMTAKHTTMAGLAERLSRVADRPVVNRTGETGAFDFELRWAPDAITPGASGADDGPSLFTALQEQLGLKLEPAKAPVEFLVVDHAERMPTEN